MIYKLKICLISCMKCGVTIYLCKHNIKPVLANLPKQSLQSCTPLVNKQFARGFHSDSLTRWRPFEIRTIYANEV